MVGMKNTSFLNLRTYTLVVGIIALSVASFAFVANASHSWGEYHWARTTSPFTLKLGKNVNATWSSYLATASTDWSAYPSTLFPGSNIAKVLNTTIVSGSGGKNCSATSGTVQVCNKKYGKNGWLGIASIWASGSHITQGTVKLNDTYFNTATYNTPAWRNMVMCQEIGHTFGLDHQDEVFGNTNLGTCMDYTNNPSTNQHPNLHDYEQLALIYAHLDTTTTLSQSTASGKLGAAALAQSGNFENASEWGKAIRTSSDGRRSLYVRDLGNNNKVFTFVIWAKN